jgi:hypothetical protein
MLLPIVVNRDDSWVPNDWKIAISKRPSTPAMIPYSSAVTARVSDASDFREDFIMISVPGDLPARNPPA